MRVLKYFVCLLVLSLSVVACERKGAGERAGEKIDRAVEDAGDKIEDAGDRVEDATDKD